MIKELKSCLFCESFELCLTQNYVGPSLTRDATYIECNNCHACGPWGRDMEEAIVEWNERND